ncbi:hypothetical protein O181_113213 [Austropuccinia psidii MF-1]|uniref:Uncharacterized protein n=1 Tax=Austropuccinia psidii MF-1 TaxID=1389203 RepID=A0A9Q3PTE7_9BASI|nr:hypothetical protein [Austropuccinia psidii MF-1]
MSSNMFCSLTPICLRQERHSFDVTKVRPWRNHSSCHLDGGFGLKFKAISFRTPTMKRWIRLISSDAEKQNVVKCRKPDMDAKEYVKRKTKRKKDSSTTIFLFVLEL